MALVKCNECGGDVSDKAAACPKCGAKPDSPVLVDSATQDAKVKAKAGLSVIHWIGIATAGGLLTLCSMVNKPGSGLTYVQEKRSDASSMAHIQCKDFVMARLKAPSTAEFAFLEYQSEKLPDNQYIIRASVEAQNAFGVKLKNNYVCNVQWNGRNKSDIANWTLVYLKIDE